MNDLPALDTPQKSSSFYMGLGFFICLLVLLTLAVLKLNVWLEDEQQAPVQDIVVSGDRIYIDDRQ